MGLKKPTALPHLDVPPQRRQGFSLLEIAIAISLLTIVTLSTVLLLVPIARQSRLQREIEAANLATKRVLEKIQATPFKDILAIYPQSSSIAIPELPNGSLVLTYTDPSADPLVIQANLTWESPEIGTLQRTFHTVRTE
ncbi:MAG: prepilin-type N-terminal cleavage/methylation domain-containing protein [Planctomycetes bacterium]|nr:prepilin-type N-terminal cleavage/methylation domain-containing protein [Planctomycetota bacterium]